MKLSKLIVLIVSLFLAFAVVAQFFPKINGGAGEMPVVIFLTVGFKATIEHFLTKRRKKDGIRNADKPSV